MKTHSLIKALLFAGVTTSVSAVADEHDHDHGAHVHGVASINLAIEGGQIELYLESAADNLLGFEHPPETAEQKNKVAKLNQQLANASKLFTLNADCKLKATSIDILGIEDNEPHSDVFATYKGSCKNGSGPTSIDFVLLNTYSGIEDLKVQWITSNKQGSKTLEKDHSVLNIQ